MNELRETLFLFLVILTTTQDLSLMNLNLIQRQMHMSVNLSNLKDLHNKIRMLANNFYLISSDLKLHFHFFFIPAKYGKSITFKLEINSRNEFNKLPGCCSYTLENCVICRIFASTKNVDFKSQKNRFGNFPWIMTAI